MAETDGLTEAESKLRRAARKVEALAVFHLWVLEETTEHVLRKFAGKVKDEAVVRQLAREAKSVHDAALELLAAMGLKSTVEDLRQEAWR